MVEISVIMGVYNAESTLARCLDSVLSQSLSNFELIICDDASSDASAEILASYQAKDSRIKLLKNETNRGLAYSLNRCIQSAKADCLVRQDADDLSLPLRFEKQVEYLRLHPELSVAGTAAELRDKSGVWGRLVWPVSPTVSQWVSGPQVIHPTCIMRRIDVLEVGGYDPEAIRVEDMDLWFRLLAAGKQIGNQQESLYAFTWGRDDYARKKARHRVTEAIGRYRGYRRLGVSWYHYIYVLKPLLLAMMPHVFLYANHKKRFTEN